MHSPMAQRSSGLSSGGGVLSAGVSSLVSGKGILSSVVGIGEVVSGSGGGFGGGWAGGRRDQMSLLSLLRFASTHTRHGWR